MKFIWISSKNWTILKIILILFQSILPVILLYLLKLLIDALSNIDAIEFNQIVYIIVIFGVVGLLNAAIGNLSQLASEAQQEKVADFMATLIQKKSKNIDLTYYENPKYLNIFHRAQSQGLYKPVQILNSITSIIQHTIALLAISGLLIYLQWYVLLIIVLATLPKIFVKLIFSKKLYIWQKETTQKQRESSYLNIILTDLYSAKELRVFNYGNFFISKFSELRKQLFTDKLKINKLKFWNTIIASTFEVIASTTAYGIIAWNTFNGNYSVGDLVLYIQAYQKAQGLFQSQLSELVQLKEHNLFISDLFEFLNIPSKIHSIKEPTPCPKSIYQGISFNNINFSYPDQINKALNNASLNFKKGEVTALIGLNGSGKTTAIKLLSRLYDPDEGNIKVDDIDIKSIDVKDWRNKISIIFQDFSKYNLTVSENISISDIESEVNDEKLVLAARNSDSDVFIEKLKKKYNNKLGKKFQGGAELSGGQWQKIALSRAFYKNAEVIVLDEPTSAIDPLAEYSIFQNLKSIASEKIVILITHRLYNLKLADKIYLLENGTVAEEGNHHQLMELNGKYKQMFDKQT